ncbi:MAG: hypothetical protein K0S57_1362 [Ramlibacter sp.]|jgi:hypothetical protein|nr:hypothetical protein [Ramlibacter sp.]
MAEPFKHSADSLDGFFSQAGRAFYVPYYQRNYSWDDENATKLAKDIFSGVRRTLTKHLNSVFLGTVILHDEKSVKLGVHEDTPNLLTKVSNVVDGQQRITSLAMLACLLYELCGTNSTALRAAGGGAQPYANLADELADEMTALQEFFSVEIKKSGAQPPRKPIIVRAGDITGNPVSDQWTLKGNVEAFYKSNAASLLAQVINGVPSTSLLMDERLRCVMDAFAEVIEFELSNADQTLAQRLIVANGTPDGTLERFTGYPPDLSVVLSRSIEEQHAFFSAFLLLAACKYLRNGCRFVVIECLDEGLAFDMFQSLNATGTPLTAFEVFKPSIVMAWGANYSTGIKPEVDRIERVFDVESTANRKEDVTDQVIVSTALVYNGFELPRRFSEERDWLTGSLEPPGSHLSFALIESLADQAEYFDKFVRPRRSAKDSANFSLVNHLISLGMSNADADMAGLCLFYLRDAQHHMAHSVLSVFYAKLLRARGTGAVAAAGSEFLASCKAAAAFFTLWMGAARGRFPDADYKKLFDQTAANMSVATGAANQSSSFLKQAFRNALETQRVYDAASSTSARSLWVALAKQATWYQRRAVCRFGLFIAGHDAVPDTTPGNEGLTVSGMPGTATFLTAKAWHASDYEVIEHVATRDEPRFFKYTPPDARIYPGNYSVVDKIGNLTLLSVPINSSVYSEWADKIFYYWSLTMPQAAHTGPSGPLLMAKLGITTLPPSLSALHAASNYLPQLAPLALRGMEGLPWDSGFIERRSEHICERIFDVLDSWLR